MSQYTNHQNHQGLTVFKAELIDVDIINSYRQGMGVPLVKPMQVLEQYSHVAVNIAIVVGLKLRKMSKETKE